MYCHWKKRAIFPRLCYNWVFGWTMNIYVWWFWFKSGTCFFRWSKIWTVFPKEFLQQIFAAFLRKPKMAELEEAKTQNFGGVENTSGSWMGEGVSQRELVRGGFPRLLLRVMLTRWIYISLLYGCWTQNRGSLPLNYPFVHRVFHDIFTIHFGGKIPLFLVQHPYKSILLDHGWRIVNNESLWIYPNQAKCPGSGVLCVLSFRADFIFFVGLSN